MRLVKYEWLTIMLMGSELIVNSAKEKKIIKIDSKKSVGYSEHSIIINAVEDLQIEGWVVFSNGILGTENGYPLTIWFTLKRGS